MLTAWAGNGKTLARLALASVLVGGFVCPQQGMPAETNPPMLKTSEGLEIIPCAVAPQVEFPMFAAFDERGRLFVAESSGGDLYEELQKQTRRCRIRLLEDIDGDGRYERSKVWADKLVFPMGLVWRDGKLYVADPPNLITLEDTDGNGTADRRRVLLSGFGHTDNGSLHGLTFGRDGRLYMTMGSPDGYRLRAGDGSMLEGESGALIRCRANGSDLEVMARGFVNLVEVGFTPRGDVVGTDNWYQQPRDGMRDALVHIVDGGLYPYHPDRGTPQPVTGAPLPAMTLYPAVAHSGLAYVEGATLPRMQGSLVSAQHNTRRVVGHELVANGSTFATRDHDLVTTEDADFHPSDVVEDADGTLLVIDTGSWYIHHCPTGQIRQAGSKGGIYRVRPQGWKPPRDAWGLRIDWGGVADKRLIELLGDARWAVRERASAALVARGSSASAALVEGMRSEKSAGVSQRLIWVLAQIGDRESVEALRGALGEANVEVVITAARGLAFCGDKSVSYALAGLLTHKSGPVQLAAAEALGRCGSVESVPAVWDALRRKPDRFVDHALTLAAYRVADERSLVQALADEHPAVRRTAMLIIEQRFRERDILKAADVFESLRAEDRELSAAARWVLLRHAEWGDEALKALSELIGNGDFDADKQRQLGELVHAFAHHEGVSGWVGESIADTRLGENSRRALLQVVAELPRATLPEAWVDAIGRALSDESATVQLAAVRAAAVRQLAELDHAVLAVAENDGASEEVRFEALRAGVLRNPVVSSKSAELLLARLDVERSPEERLAAAEVIGRCRLTGEQLERLIDCVSGDALISPSTFFAQLASAPSEQHGPVASYLLDAVEQGWNPNKLEAGKLFLALSSAEPGQLERLRTMIDGQHEATRAQLREYEHLLTGGDEELGRQVFFGKKVACASCHAMGSEGGRVGPDLTKIGAVRAPADLLEAIVAPGASIAQGFDTFAITLVDGRTMNGVVVGEPGEVVVIRDSAGNELRLSRDGIDAMQRIPASTMPDGLAKALSQAELQGLLAYLRSRK